MTAVEGSLAVWSILKSAVEGYIAHGALSRGAAIAFYVVTSLAPVLLIVVAVAGIVFGQDAVRGGLVQQLSGLFGQQGGELIQTMLASLHRLELLHRAAQKPVAMNRWLSS